MAEDLRAAALEYHRFPTPGKIEVTPTKSLATQRDLALAYSPGVAEPCLAIFENPAEAAAMTARGNLVAVITNGTAVLGLGNIGPLAAKPVMEGKGVLFKKFAGIDVFDIEIAADDPDKFVEIVAALEPTFGGINLEDIKAPECFEIEARLKERMKIPVMHDDQHGTAIIVAAAVKNALQLTGRKIEEVKIVASGAGAAAMACLDLLVSMGLAVENAWVCDRKGLVYEGRGDALDSRKARYAKQSNLRTLDEVIHDADIFLGLSGPGTLSPDLLPGMAPNPIILALANPTPEILPELALERRPDAIVATGRSDYPNQVNNALCFPYLFRGALDCGATTINEEMKIACVNALAELAQAEMSDVVAAVYGDQNISFGPKYLIPTPFDPRLITRLAPAVAQAAADSGVALRPIADFEAYRQSLNRFVFRSGLVMKPVMDRARLDPRRIVYAEGEDERVLRAVQQVLSEGLAKPILIGRREVVSRRIERLNLHFVLDRDIELVDPQSDPRFAEYSSLYHSLTERQGVSPDYARTVVRTRTTVIAALMVRRGEAEAMICGTQGTFHRHLLSMQTALGLAPGASSAFALAPLVLRRGTYFIADPYVVADPTADQIVEMTLRAAEAVRQFGIEPKVALLSHSNFGSSDTTSAQKMRTALGLIRTRAPDLEVEGEMQAEMAFSQPLRDRIFPNSRLSGAANLLIMPTLDAANIAFNMLKALGDGLDIGPILMGLSRPAHIVTPAVTVQGLVNMTALAVCDAQMVAAPSDREPVTLGVTG